MTTLIDLLRSDYPGHLAAGMVVNFHIAGLALLSGLAIGVPLAAIPIDGCFWRWLSGPAVSVMRAAPTFVVMFFLLNAIPQDLRLADVDVGLSATTIVALSLTPYATAYTADNGREALLSLRRGSVEGAVLFLPNIMRAFFVLVMSSSTAAAIGVNEGAAVVLREAERMSHFADKLVVFAIGVAAFGFVFQLGLSIARIAALRLARYAAGGWASHPSDD